MINIIITRLKINVNLKKIIATQIVILFIAFLLVNAFNSYSDEYKETQQIVVGISNNDSSPATGLLLNNFKNTNHFSGLFNIIDIKESEIKSLMDSGKIDSAIILPEGFAEGLYYFDNKPIDIITKTSIPTKNAILNETLRGFSDYVKAVDMASHVYNQRLAEMKKSKEDKKELARAFNLELLKASIGRGAYFDITTVSNVPVVSSTEYYLSAIPISLITFISIMSGLRKLKEDSLKIAFRIELSGINKLKQILAFYISEILNVLILMSLLIIYSMYKNGLLYGIRITISIIICYAFWCAIWRLVAGMTRSRETLSITCISISFISCLVAGGIVPYLLLPTWTKTLAEYSINFSLNRYILGGTDFQSVLMFVPVFAVLFIADFIMSKRGRNDKIYSI